MELELSDGDAVAVQRRTVDVPDFSGDALRMSDVVLAYGIEETMDGKPLGAGEFVSPGPIRSGRLHGVFSRSSSQSTCTLSSTTSRCRTDSRHTRSKAASKRKMRSVVFGAWFAASLAATMPASPSGSRGTAQARTTGSIWIMDVSDVEPGLYTIVVVVTDSATGRSVERSKDLFLE